MNGQMNCPPFRYFAETVQTIAKPAKIVAEEQGLERPFSLAVCLQVELAFVIGLRLLARQLAVLVSGQVAAERAEQVDEFLAILFDLPFLFLA